MRACGCWKPIGRAELIALNGVLDPRAKFLNFVSRLLVLTGLAMAVLRKGAVSWNSSECTIMHYRWETPGPHATSIFTATGDMTTPRNAHAAVLLPDGTVLITGGEGWGPLGDMPCCVFLGSIASAELYDSSTGTFAPTASMTARRADHTATVLNDGRVLVTGGVYEGGIGILYGNLSSAEIYAPPLLLPAPVLFSMSGDGKGQGAIWHATTGTLASADNPAVAGEVLSMYTTSLVENGVGSTESISRWHACGDTLFRRRARISRL